jgi:hypothetical protein
VQVLSEARGFGGGKKGTATARVRAAVLTDDPNWRQRASAWIDAYWTDHRHGPTWSEFRNEPSLWPQDVTPTIRRAAMTLLARNGHFDGTKTPYGLKTRTED